MPVKQIVLIRGINVGRAKRVAMADLRVLVEELGCRDVRTVLNSGNIVFTAPDALAANSAARIEQAITARFGLSARVMALTADEFSGIVDDNPLGPVVDNPSRLLVAFLANSVDLAQLTSLKEQEWTPEVLAIGVRAAYLWCPAGILASRLAEAVGRVLRDAVTTRNWATVVKIHALVK